MEMASWVLLFEKVGLPLIDRMGKPLKSFFLPKKAAQAANWAARLNNEFEGRARLFGITPSLPTVRVTGRYPLTPEQTAFARAERKRLGGKQPNDPHAILAKTPVWTDNPVVFEVQTLDFAEVSALRHEKLLPQVISANAVICCAQTQEIVLHRRSEKSATYPGALHVIGGAYIPPGVDGREADRQNLFDTARREVFEESRVGLTWDDQPALLLAQELDTGFIQLGLLAVNVSPAQVAALEHSIEGDATRVKFADLHHVLRTELAPDPHTPHSGWVPTGKAHVLAWLALGAPGAGKKPRFGNLGPVELFDLFVRA
jgi:hypothetical protein